MYQRRKCQENIESYSTPKITDRIKLARCVCPDRNFIWQCYLYLDHAMDCIFVCDQSSGKWSAILYRSRQLVGIGQSRKTVFVCLGLFAHSEL